MDPRREAVVQEALTWLGTRYHHQASTKGVGVDCVWILIRVYQAVGMLDPAFDPGPYSRDWYEHSDEQLYMGGVARYARRLTADEEPQPGDIPLFHVKRCVAHGGILLGDGQMIHAHGPSRKVVIHSLLEDSPITRSLHSYWTPFL